MKFDTRQFPLISETTSFHFVDARMSDKEIKSRHRRERAMHLIAAAAIVVVFALVVSQVSGAGVSLA